ncbi:Zinc finger protein 532 [Labeo rohita]|uniref:Zinc finger protein 532 n=1 Tax=Labeo rohita TaxID=84645 RepID=A0ABQ8L9J3_LABRO|nr:Zinc finger protein 532 [Labeo rohita]
MWPCKVCDTSFSSWYELLKHFRLKHIRYSRNCRYPCPYVYCPCTFKMWKNHTYQTHRKSTTTTTTHIQLTTFFCQACVFKELSTETEYFAHDCESEEAESGIAQTTVGINVIRGKGANPGDVGVVLQGLAVLQNLQSITHGCAMLLGLIYALNLNYPKDLKCTFEAFQKILTELDSAKLSPIDF